LSLIPRPAVSKSPTEASEETKEGPFTAVKVL
jgi:hypothetical protein